MKKLLLALALFLACPAFVSASALPMPAPTILDGDIVKTADSFNVYIVKYNAGKQYKRLILNPLVFQSYRHLKWENLLIISNSVMDSYVTSDLVRVDGTTDIYQLVPEGDNGGKYLLTSAAGYDLDSVYTINGVDFGNYEKRGERGPLVAANKIVAIYELEDKVVYVAEKPATSIFYTWSLPQYESEYYFSRGTSFDSSENGEIIRSGMEYQIKLDATNSPDNMSASILSDKYIFQGNRAVIDSSVCPYVRYVNNECGFKEIQDPVDADLAMLSPQGGETWFKEQSYTISWKAVGADKVDLILYKGGNCAMGLMPISQTCNSTDTSNSLPYLTIATGISNTGSYEWHIPSTVSGGCDYRIAVRSSSNPAHIVQSKCVFSIYGAHDMIAMKPVLYLYPQTPQEIAVSLDFDGVLTATYPAYDNGWKVFASPDGTLINSSDGKEYSYLFWEGTYDQKIDYNLSKGFVVAGKDTAAFLQSTLSRMGLTPKEYNEFIVYWMPRMQNNKYNLIHFADKEEYDDHARLTISPQPDSLLRIFMVYKPLEETQVIAPQMITPFVRTGFSAVEWGGAEIR